MENHLKQTITHSRILLCVISCICVLKVDHNTCMCKHLYTSI